MAETNLSRQFPPVVSVLGHVDHGKTTLLDKIRSTSIAEREKGGITQKIGASHVVIDHEGKKRSITFIDTPGHEAFANMRSQGVNAADIVLLIIAADDGIKPQTKESIEKIKETKIPFIVVFTKIDMEGASLEKVKQQVLKEGILLEGLGGDTPYIGVSGKTGENVKDLLGLIILVYDLSGIKKEEDRELLSVVIDCKLDKRRGIVSSVVIKQGTLSVGKNLFVHGKNIGRVRAIVDTNGKNTKSSFPGEAVEILGLTEVVPSGTVLFDRQVEPVRVSQAIDELKKKDIMEFLADEEPDTIPIILKTETSAEMEALKNSLPGKVKIIFEGQGDIGVSDILMAKDFHALVIGFNVNTTKEAQLLAESEKIFHKSYGIIYELLDELSNLLLALSQKKGEKELGTAQILAAFTGTTGVILGIKVSNGRIGVNDRIKVLRGEKEIGSAVVTSIKRGKTDVKQADKGLEYGIMIAPQVDFAPGDAIIAYSNRK